MGRSYKPTVPLTAADRTELLSLAASDHLREDMRFTIRHGRVSIDHYIAFATSFDRFENHPCRPFRSVNDNLFKL